MTPEQWERTRARAAEWNRANPSAVAAKRAALIAPYTQGGTVTETLAIMRMPAADRRRVRDCDRLLREWGR